MCWDSRVLGQILLNVTITWTMCGLNQLEHFYWIGKKGIFLFYLTIGTCYLQGESLQFGPLSTLVIWKDVLKRVFKFVATKKERTTLLYREGSRLIKNKKNKLPYTSLLLFSKVQKKNTLGRLAVVVAGVAVCGSMVVMAILIIYK
jgi:hypothetical protein